jgi:soluble lytic murein transglycosylase-like protein
MLKFIPILTLVGLLGCVTPAEAQIYAWRDSHGILVLSDRPLDPYARSFAVARTSTVRATRAVAIGAGKGYDDLIERHAAANQIRSDLVRAVIQVESGYNRYAQSRKGAMGLMQLMPSTAAQMGARDPYDPAQNIRAGVAYLRRLLDRYADNEELALAAYNAGPEAVDQHGSTIPPYRETRNYVKRIKGMTAVSAVSTERAIYKTIEFINGRPLPRYSDTKPTSGDYEIVALAR